MVQNWHSFYQIRKKQNLPCYNCNHLPCHSTDSEAASGSPVANCVFAIPLGNISGGKPRKLSSCFRSDITVRLQLAASYLILVRAKTGNQMEHLA